MPLEIAAVSHVFALLPGGLRRSATRASRWRTPLRDLPPSRIGKMNDMG